MDDPNQPSAKLKKGLTQRLILLCILCLGSAISLGRQFNNPSQFLLPSVYSEEGLAVVLDNHNSTDSKGVKQAEPNLPVPVNNNGLLLRFRTQPLNATKGFSFTHISKCAGASLITELRQIFRTFFPRQSQGVEYSVAYQDKVSPNFDYHLISLKSPRHHVWSMWAECAFDFGWANHSVPRYGHSDVENFELWLDHFLIKENQTGDWQPHGNHMYGCMHPSNYQSRHLTAHRDIQFAHGLVKYLAEDDNGTTFEPGLQLAIKTLHTLDWVALADFYPESKCLLFYRLFNTGKIQPKILNYLETRCVCSDDVGTSITNTNSSHGDGHGFKDVHVTHHNGPRRKILSDLPIELLDKIAALTRVDVQVYQRALSDFLQEMIWLESPGALNRRVLCDETLERLEPEFAYMTNLTALYSYLKTKR
jgi:hypothetical protein